MIIDILTCLMLVLALYKGWTKGLIMSVFELVAFFLGMTLAFHFSGKLAGYLAKEGSDSKWYPFLAFIIILIATIILVRIIGKVLEAAAELMLMGLLNKLLGIFIYAFIYLTLFASVLFYLNKYHILIDSVITDSYTGKYVFNFGKWVTETFSSWLPEMKNLFTSAKENIKQGVSKISF
jgi:membrane protein required for colicin V production